ncbi:hypothetical protein C2W62_00945 [Candidatus Entotheonella serta]|nr:hypothetical protein C2W62_00945 [Candidatus Entotheonella serta]
MIYTFGDYELEPQRYELRCQKRVCHLEPQVLELLSYLMRHRDRVVTKQELFEHLWPTQFVSDATQHQRLTAARKAIGDSGRDQHTIRRRGRSLSTITRGPRTALSGARWRNPALISAATRPQLGGADAFAVTSCRARSA